MTKFPNLIHVTEAGSDEETHFQVSTDGVASLDEAGQAIAIYQLVSVGHLQIQKAFVEAPRRTRRPLAPTTPRKR